MSYCPWADIGFWAEYSFRAQFKARVQQRYASGVETAKKAWDRAFSIFPWRRSAAPATARRQRWSPTASPPEPPTAAGARSAAPAEGSPKGVPSEPPRAWFWPAFGFTRGGQKKASQAGSAAACKTGYKASSETGLEVDSSGTPSGGSGLLKTPGEVRHADGAKAATRRSEDSPSDGKGPPAPDGGSGAPDILGPGESLAVGETRSEPRSAADPQGAQSSASWAPRSLRLLLGERTAAGPAEGGESTGVRGWAARLAGALRSPGALFRGGNYLKSGVPAEGTERGAAPGVRSAAADGASTGAAADGASTGAAAAAASVSESRVPAAETSAAPGARFAAAVGATATAAAAAAESGMSAPGRSSGAGGEGVSAAREGEDRERLTSSSGTGTSDGDAAPVARGVKTVEV